MAERIGRVLVEMGVLADWQVEKILEHQRFSRQRFGQVAVAWGWAEPQDVWEAWARQLCAEARQVDLDEVGVDTAAIEKVPSGIARHYQVVAIRTWGDHLVLAVPEHSLVVARRELPHLLAGRLYFCTAERAQVQRALERAYALPVG